MKRVFFFSFYSQDVEIIDFSYFHPSHPHPPPPHPRSYLEDYGLWTGEKDCGHAGGSRRRQDRALYMISHAQDRATPLVCSASRRLDSCVLALPLYIAGHTLDADRAICTVRPRP